MRKPRHLPLRLTAQAQLALQLFVAGYWHEAHQVAERAAGRAMLRRECPPALFVYAVAALVPIVQGRAEEVEDLLAQLEEVREHEVPLLAGLIEWLRAVGAVVTGDHEASMHHLLAMRDDTGDGGILAWSRFCSWCVPRITRGGPRWSPPCVTPF
ncbi:hypothetical protein GCM10009771_17090 [Nesterenkonia flava]